MTTETEQFARLLVELVRDASIRSNDMELRDEAGSPVAKRWRKAGLDGARPLARIMIPDIVDETVFALLQAIDEGQLRMAFTTSDGKSVDLGTSGKGELAGWYMGSEGWRERYSQERYFDDFADLKGVDPTAPG